jgi:hypothetical protein
LFASTAPFLAQAPSASTVARTPTSLMERIALIVRKVIIPVPPFSLLYRADPNASRAWLSEGSVNLDVALLNRAKAG